jgi:hypothetical protein
MRRALTIALISLLLGAVLQQAAFWQHLFAPSDRVMAPIQSSRNPLGDEYYYYVLSKKAAMRLEGLWSSVQYPESFFAKNSGLEYVYSGGLFVAGLLELAAQAVPVTWPFKALLSLVLQTSFLLAAVMTAYMAFHRNDRLPWIELLLFCFAWCYFMSGFMYATYVNDFSIFFTTRAISYFPDILRLVNPQMGWAYMLFYTSLLTSWYREPTKLKYTLLILTSLFCGVFSIPVVAMLLIGLGMFGLATLIAEKKLDFPLLGIVVALLASFAYTYHQIQLSYLTEKGRDLMTGSFVGLNLKPHYFLLLVFLPLIRKQVPEHARSPLSWLYVAALLIGVINHCFELGSRLWLRGTSAFAWMLIAYSLADWVRMKCQRPWDRLVARPLVPPIIALALALGTYAALDVKLNRWTGYIEREKAEVIEWLRDNTTQKDVVLSADLEDAYFIPLYTKAQPYVQLYDYGVLTPNEAVERYFRALDLVGLKENYTSRIISYSKSEYSNDGIDILKNLDRRMPYDNYQIFAFFGVILYYPYAASTRDIFASEDKTKAFNEKIISTAKNATARDVKKVNFIVINKNTDMKEPPGYQIMFENSGYQIMSKPLAS